MPRVLLGRHTPVQDEIIIEVVRRGDRDAFASIVERYHGAVYGYLRARLVGVAPNVLREHIRKMIRRNEVAWTELCLALDGRNQDETSMYGEAVNVSSPGGPAAWSGRKTSRRDA